MKNKKWTLAVLTAITILTLAACNLPQVSSEESVSDVEIQQDITEVQENTVTDLKENEVTEVQEEMNLSDVEIDDAERSIEKETTDIYTYQTEILMDEEVSDLIWMREEEKLARDVYLTLYEMWNLNIFNNIASSEQQHTDAVKNLLVAYDLPDIVTDDTVGIFANSELQKLYDELVAKGSQSLADALLVGGLIEELDILDLQEAIANTEREDILEVYNNLLKGSYNHLQAFISNYERQASETYTPQLMSSEDFEQASAISSSRGQGSINRP